MNHQQAKTEKHGRQSVKIRERLLGFNLDRLISLMVSKLDMQGESVSKV